VASERSFFPRLTARENLDFFATLDDVKRAERPERVNRILSITELEDVGDTLVMKFSSGMYQRLAIARALLKEPSVLLLDEPSRSLDPAAAHHFWEWLKRTAEQGCTVLLATHSFDEAIRVANSVAILSHGRVLTRRQVVPGMTVSDLRECYFGEIRRAAAFEAAGVNS
jgi:ABC-2 type transport system ATP-binding protein